MLLTAGDTAGEALLLLLHSSHRTEMGTPVDCRSSLIDPPDPKGTRTTGRPPSSMDPDSGVLLARGVDEDWDIALDSLLDDETEKQLQMASTSSSSFFDTSSDDGNGAGRKRRRVGSEDDARRIKEATEAMLNLLKLDPNSEEGKRQRRRLRNRMSAAMHRERKKELIDTLEDKLREKEEEVQDLRRRVEALLAENATLKQRLGMQSTPAYALSPPSAYSSACTSSDSESESSVSSSHRPRSFGSPLSAGVSLLSFMCILGFGFRGVPQLTQLDGREVLWQRESSYQGPPGRFLLVHSSDQNETSTAPFQSVTLSPAPPTIALKDFTIQSPISVEATSFPPLYSYSEKVLHLYPPIEKSVKIEVTTTSTNHSHLRTRSKPPSSRDLVPIQMFKEPEVARPPSQLLVSQGQALLDPLLLASHLLPAPPERPAFNDKAVATYRILQQDKPSYPLAIVPSSKENLLMMVLPVSAIRWGSSWQDSSASLLETILRMNGNENETRAAGGADSLWVEIGCSVFRAELVRNATLNV